MALMTWRGASASSNRFQPEDGGQESVSHERPLRMPQLGPPWPEPQQKRAKVTSDRPLNVKKTKNASESLRFFDLLICEKKQWWL